MEKDKMIDTDEMIDLDEMPYKESDFLKIGTFPTGISSLDKMLGGGLRRGSLTVIAARPGMGKTSLALQLAGNIAAVGKSVCFYSLEMSKDSLIRILEKQSGSIHGYKTLHIDDHANADVPYITGKIHSLAKCDAVFVDYLQLMHSTKRKDKRVQELTEITRDLKLMTKSLNVPVVVCAQLSRSTEGRGKGASYKPQLADLREPGSIEQDADIVIFPFRKSYYSEESKLNDKNELIVAKNRYGPTGSIPVHWNLDKLKYEEQSE